MFKKLAAFFLPLACAFSVRATDLAQFSAYAYPNNSNPVNVSFPNGSVLNPTNTNSFSVSIINSGTWSSTPIPVPPFSVPGTPTGGNVPNSQLTSALISTLSLGSGGLDVLGFKAAAAAVVTITLNFTGLPSGYLPAGSMLTYIDVDFLETTTITGASGWFNLGTITALDATNGSPISPGELNTTAADFTTFSSALAGTQLVLSGTTAATDSPAVVIPIAANTTSLNIVAQNSNTPTATFYQSLAITIVPEPSSIALLGTVAVPFFVQLVRRRKK